MEEEQDDAEKMHAACSRTLVGRCPARRPGRRTSGRGRVKFAVDTVKRVLTQGVSTPP